MRNPEFQLVAWTIKFYVQIETRAALPAKAPGAKDARTAASRSTNDTRKR